MSDQASTIQVNTIEPQSGTTLTVGKSGQNLVVNADSLKANVAKDAGGNALFTSDGSGTISGLNSGFGSAQVLISTQSGADLASISFTSGIDSTYKEYVFEFFEVNPATAQLFQINFSSDGGSNYNMTKTTTFFRAYHYENNSGDGLGYDGSFDIAEGTAAQPLNQHTGSDADMCVAGELHLFSPSSTTYVKNFYSRSNNYAAGAGGISQEAYVGGYVNSTTAINAVQFAMASGNFDGKIKMYGIK